MIIDDPCARLAFATAEDFVFVGRGDEVEAALGVIKG